MGKTIICFIIFGTLCLAYILSNFFRVLLGGENTDLTLTQLIDQQAIEYGWLIKLVINCFGYAFVFVPGILIYQYVKRSNCMERIESGLIYACLNICLIGTDADRNDINQILRFSTTSNNNSNNNNSTNSNNINNNNSKRSFIKDFILICYCFFGLMASYLTWGLLQEKIMTQEYENETNSKKTLYKDSQFLVFVNRGLAFLIAAGYLFFQRFKQQRHKAPLYKYSYASLSNILSAWFQYEALKFVNFPTQVLAKSCKIIPVMIMGKIISKNKYEFYEYFTAILISFGMILFLTGSADGNHGSSITTMTGVLLLTLYMLFDSFTSNWQGDLFKVYGMTSMHMMFGVNLFSTLLTGASLSIQGGFMESINFATHHPKFIVDCVILSLSSAVGQLFIFYTISTFGAVVFTIIMTFRQCVAILLSCIVYKHYISIIGTFGVMLVFVAILLRVYCNQRLKTIRRRIEAAKPTV